MEVRGKAFEKGLAAGRADCSEVNGIDLNNSSVSDTLRIEAVEPFKANVRGDYVTEHSDIPR
jgi:hypothetical protein